MFRRFQHAGLNDAHRQVGAGLVVTWPRTGRNGVTLPAMVHLDHVLFRGMDVTDAGALVIPDSDHDAVWAALVPSPPNVGR